MLLFIETVWMTIDFLIFPRFHLLVRLAISSGSNFSTIFPRETKRLVCFCLARARWRFSSNCLRCSACSVLQLFNFFHLFLKLSIYIHLPLRFGCIVSDTVCSIDCICVNVCSVLEMISLEVSRMISRLSFSSLVSFPVDHPAIYPKE